jgi:hypothetical protein
VVGERFAICSGHTEKLNSVIVEKELSNTFEMSCNIFNFLVSIAQRTVYVQSSFLFLSFGSLDNIEVYILEINYTKQLQMNPFLLSLWYK